MITLRPPPLYRCEVVKPEHPLARALTSMQEKESRAEEAVEALKASGDGLPVFGGVSPKMVALETRLRVYRKAVEGLRQLCYYDGVIGFPHGTEWER